MLYDIEDFPDAVYYKQLGNLFFKNGTIAGYKVMPLYPIISGLKEWSGIGTFYDIFISAGSAVLIYYLYQEVFGKNKGAILAGVLWAIYPFSIFYSISNLTESTFTFLLLLSFLLLYKKEFYWAFAVIVLSILVRPTLDYLTPILIIYFGVSVHQMSLKKALLLLPKYVLIYSMMMFPWWLHNSKQYNSFVRLNLGDGVMWYDGNNPLNTTGSGREGNMDHSEFKEIDDPVIRNNALKAAAFRWIKSNPKQFVILVGKRLKRFWNIFPNAKEYNSNLYLYISVFSFLPILIGSTLFFFLADNKILIRTGPIILLILYLTFVHSVTVGSIRYRFPLEGFMIILSCFSVFSFYKIKLEKIED